MGGWRRGRDPGVVVLGNNWGGVARVRGEG